MGSAALFYLLEFSSRALSAINLINLGFHGLVPAAPIFFSHCFQCDSLQPERIHKLPFLFSVPRMLLMTAPSFPFQHYAFERTTTQQVHFPPRWSPEAYRLLLRPGTNSMCVLQHSTYSGDVCLLW